MVMMRSWRRTPSGKGHQALVQQRESLNPANFRKNFLSMTEAEFADALRLERASTRFIEKELAVFRVLKAEADEKKNRLQKARTDRANREVDGELSWYAKAEAMMKNRKKERSDDDETAV